MFDPLIELVVLIELTGLGVDCLVELICLVVEFSVCSSLAFTRFSRLVRFWLPDVAILLVQCTRGNPGLSLYCSVVVS